MSKEVHLRADRFNTPRLRQLQSRYRKKFPSLRPLSFDDLGNLAMKVGIARVARHLGLN